MNQTLQPKLCQLTLLLLPKSYSNLSLNELTLQSILQPSSSETTYLLLDNWIGLAQIFKLIINDHKTKDIWESGMCKGLRCIAQEYPDAEEINTYFFSRLKTNIRHFKGQNKYLWQHSCLLSPPEKNPYFFRITVSGNLIS